MWYLCTKSVLFHLTHQSLVPDPLCHSGCTGTVIQTFPIIPPNVELIVLKLTFRSILPELCPLQVFFNRDGES